RFRRTDDGTGQVNSNTLYLDNVERVTTGGSVTWRRTVAGTVMTLAGTTAGLVNSTRTLLGDQIGSVDAVADLSSGGLVERADYAAFGAMRTALSAVVVGVAPLTTTTRGFTGQEQLATLDLVHLNGRIYDPQLGRFLQADPMVAQPYNPQNWNPYSYVFNNPLANTDPTGMFSIGKFFRTVLSIAISIFFPPIAQLMWSWNLFAGSLVAGFLSGAVSTGSLKGGIEGAFSAGLFYGIGEQFQMGRALTGPEEVAKVLEHGIAGGVMSVLEGGKFGSGFASAGLTCAAMPLAGNSGNVVVRSVEGALIGGTISEATGGKFVNGAISGAIQGAMEEPQSHNSGDTDAGSENLSTDNGDGAPRSAGSAPAGDTANYKYGTAGPFSYSMEAGYGGGYGARIDLTYNGRATNLKWLQTYQAYSVEPGEDGTWQFDYRPANATTKFYPADSAPGRTFMDFPAWSGTRYFQAETSVVSRNPAGVYSIVATVKWSYTYTAGAGLEGVNFSTPVVTTPSALQQGYIKSLNGGH
ncbi:MAG: RHS repeat-associated core domain-containing protein, partial [Proteobacteria bacterium]|nr:RHS repeat-associated core domain-containing protein [Pseudomonadota bacterium]